ncbi:T9SS type A sorting domain-containing protein [Chryseobacterium joostei]|uniref:T9SS type A sorting domain-containing protein n=1 Tax=Chryseobacterium joostei TaxID=112234 RepID=UPI0023F103E3|nr:T9SS type A sorting domain-containing protein [Chryseobacterium joostei]
MKKRLFLWLLSLPVMSYCQYYVGHDLSYPITEYVSDNSFYAGKVDTDGSSYIHVANLIKFTSNGTLSLGFGNNGIAPVIPVVYNVSSIGINDQYVYLGSNTKIGKYDKSSGAPDLSFGVNGVATILYGVGKIYAHPNSSLFAENYGKIIKLLPNGQKDNSFSIDANKDYYVIGNSIYVINSQSNSIYYIKKYDLNGVQDIQYGNGGSLQVSNWIFDKINGELYVEESSGITRYTSSGVLDTTFGNGGNVQVSFPGLINCIISDSNNNILFFGGSASAANNKSMIVRLKRNGALDNTFNNGTHIYVFPGEGSIKDVSLLDDNTYVCIEGMRHYRFGGFATRTNKYLRTQDRSKIQTLSVKDVNVTKTNVLQVYPSPATDFIKIGTGKNDKITKVNIYAITGDLVLSTDKSEIDIKHLLTGTYMIEANLNGDIYKNKFIKK